MLSFQIVRVDFFSRFHSVIIVIPQKGTETNCFCPAPFLVGSLIWTACLGHIRHRYQFFQLQIADFI